MNDPEGQWTFDSEDVATGVSGQQRAHVEKGDRHRASGVFSQL